MLQSELLKTRQIKKGGGSKNVIKIFGFISEHSLEREIKNKAKYLKKKKIMNVSIITKMLKMSFKNDCSVAPYFDKFPQNTAMRRASSLFSESFKI